MEGVGDIGKNGRILFIRPKPTVDCSVNGRIRSGNSLPMFRDNLAVLTSDHYSLRNNPQEHNSHLLRGRSLKS